MRETDIPSLDHDKADFNPVDYINANFPTEASLQNLDVFQTQISSQIDFLNGELSKSVQAQSGAGRQASQDIADAQLSIVELYDKIQDIKTKASQSELLVQEICADIKKLDYAKTHLQSSITALKRLQMLITAVGQLEILARDFHYREVANLLDAVNQLMEHFEQYTSITMIADIKTRIQSIQSELQRHVHKAFREIGQLVDTVADVETVIQSLPGNMRSLSDACLVVDALGVSARQDLLDEFVQLQLLQYERLFGMDKPHCTLDQVERRWAWFKRLLKSVESKFGNIFPPSWRFPLRLFRDFADRTKNHLFQMLTTLENRDQIDVNLLLKALQSSLRFEQEMASLFNIAGISAAIDASATKDHKGQKGDADKSLPHAHGSADSGLIKVESHELDFLTATIGLINGGISGVYDRFLNSYVLLERHNLEEMLQRLSQEEDEMTQTDSTESTNASTIRVSVYGSSISMFVFIKNSIRRCTALSTGQTFLSLSKEFRTSIQMYAELLRSRCPMLTAGPALLPASSAVSNSWAASLSVSSAATTATNASMTSPTSSSTSGQGYVKLAPGQEITIGHLINTAEYCAEVVPQLEIMIKSKIVASLSEKVTLRTEVEAFEDLIAHFVRVLVAGIFEKLENSFKEMANASWGNDAQVGEESAYILQCHSILAEYVPKLRDVLDSTYFGIFVTKIATEILNRFHDIIVKLKLISEAGSQQLLLDAYNMKTLLLHLHHVGQPSDHKASSAGPAHYTKLVQGRMSQIETLLKLVGTPDDALIERFKLMWPDGRVEDLLLLFTLKGIKRSDQQTLLDAFGPNAFISSGPSSDLSNSNAYGSSASSWGFQDITLKWTANQKN